MAINFWTSLALSSLSFHSHSRSCRLSCCYPGAASCCSSCYRLQGCVTSAWKSLGTTEKKQPTAAVLFWCLLFLLQDFPIAENIRIYFFVDNIFDTLPRALLTLRCVLPFATNAALFNILVILLLKPLNVYVYLTSSVFGWFPRKMVRGKETTVSGTTPRLWSQASQQLRPTTKPLFSLCVL